MGAGDKWEVPIGRGNGVRGGALQNSYLRL